MCEYTLYTTNNILAGLILREIRVSQGLHQDSLKGIMSSSNLSRYESGLVRIPFDTLMVLLEYYQVPVSTFASTLENYVSLVKGKGIKVYHELEKDSLTHILVPNLGLLIQELKKGS